MRLGFKKPWLLYALLSLLLFHAGCGGGGNSGEGGQPQAEMPPALREMEQTLLDTMQQADLIPVVEQLAGSQPTFEETALGEVVKREMDEMYGEDNQELPQTEEEVWDRIKANITMLADQWNNLEPLARQENVSERFISCFEENLDRLTVYSTAEDHFGVMAAANQVFGCLPQLVAPFADAPMPLVYELRYHFRHIVLSAVADDYAEARASLGLMQEQLPALTRDLNEEDTMQLEVSMDNLERAVEKENEEWIALRTSMARTSAVNCCRDVN